MILYKKQAAGGIMYARCLSFIPELDYFTTTKSL